MAEVTQLTLAVDSRQVRQASQDLEKFGRTGKATEASVSSLGGALRGLAPAVAAAAAALSVRDVVRAADTYTLLNARIKLVTASATEFAQAQREVFNISQTTRTSLESTATLFTNLSRSLQPLGASQREVLDVTESINKALIVSGTSSASASAALTQLGQAFQSGVLRGEELNSILEQAPRLAQAIADGIGVPIGALRRLGEAGELTADRVFRALQKSADSIDSEFRKIPTTVGGALTQVENSIGRLIGKLDEATGATRALASALSGVSRGIDTAVNSLSNDKIEQAAARLERLQNSRVRLSLSVSGDNPRLRLLDQEISQARSELEALRRDVGSNQSAAETARLFSRNAPTKSGPNLGTVAGIQQQIADLKKQRDAAEIGSASFQRLSAEIKRYEQQLAALNGRGGGSATAIRNVTSEAQRYLENLRQQLEATEDLSVEEQLLRDIQEGRLGNVTAAQQIELQNIASQIDAARARIEEEKKLTDEINDQIAAAKAADQANKDRLQAFIDDTPTGQLRRQNEELDFLKQALEQNKISVEQYAEIVRTRFAGANESITQQKSLADELNLSFQSAFEDAIVGGKGLSEVFKALEQDIIRAITRTEILKPLLKSLETSGLFGGGGGGFLGGIGDFISGLFGGGRAIGGPVSAGGLYRVNERGPELLTVGGREYLMMGNQGGSVTPNASGGETRNFTINVTMPQQADRATGLQFGRMIAQQLSIANSRNG